MVIIFDIKDDQSLTISDTSYQSSEVQESDKMEEEKEDISSYTTEYIN